MGLINRTRRQQLPIEGRGVAISSGYGTYLAGWTRTPVIIPPSGPPVVKLTLTETALHVDQIRRDRNGQVHPYKMLFEIPRSDITSAEVDEMRQERSEYGWKITTGFLHGPTTVKAMSGLLLHLRTGEMVLFGIEGPVMQVRANCAQLLSQLKDENPGH
jgi:hypothetical protein